MWRSKTANCLVTSVGMSIVKESATLRIQGRQARAMALLRLLLVFVLLTRAAAQLISHSVLHFIDRGTLRLYNLTHPDDMH